MVVLAERNPPIEEVIQSGVVPSFVEFLAREDYPQLQVCTEFIVFFFCRLSSFLVFTSSLVSYDLV